MASNRLHLSPQVQTLPLSFLRRLPALKYLNLGGARLNCSLAPAPDDAAQALKVKQAAEMDAAAAGAAAAAEITDNQPADQSAPNAREELVEGSPIPPLMRASSLSAVSEVTTRPTSAVLPPLASPRSSPRLKVLASQSEPTTPSALGGSTSMMIGNRRGVAFPNVRVAWNESASSPSSNTNTAAATPMPLVPKPFSRWPSGLLELRLFECGLEGQLPPDLNQLRRIKVVY